VPVEMPVTRAMKFGVTCLLLVCSLSALCEDGKGTAGAVAGSSPSLATGQELKDKLEWNVKPVHWENLVGKDASAAGPVVVSDNLVSGGPVASKFDLSNGAGAASDNTMKEADVERVLRKMEKQEGLRLGQSDYVFRSPILEGLIPRPAPDGASLGEKILNLPIVRWFRPLPMPEPPGGGKYFKWGERAESWRDIGHPTPPPGAIDNGM